MFSLHFILLTAWVVEVVHTHLFWNKSLSDNLYGNIFLLSCDSSLELDAYIAVCSHSFSSGTLSCGTRLFFSCVLVDQREHSMISFCVNRRDKCCFPGTYGVCLPLIFCSTPSFATRYAFRWNASCVSRCADTWDGGTFLSAFFHFAFRITANPVFCILHVIL